MLDVDKKALKLISQAQRENGANIRPLKNNSWADSIEEHPRLGLMVWFNKPIPGGTYTTGVYYRKSIKAVAVDHERL